MMGLGETKLRILERLRSREGGVRELALELNLSRVAVHRHLSELVQQGLVRSKLEKCESRGRPRQVFSAADPEAPYARICDEVLTSLKKLYGAEVVHSVLDARNQRLIDRMGRFSGMELDDQLSELASLLTGEGYQARVHKEDEAWLLEQHRCPRLAVSREHKEICQSEARAYSMLISLPMIQETRIADGESCCRYRIAKPGASETED